MRGEIRSDHIIFLDHLFQWRLCCAILLLIRNLSWIQYSFVDPAYRHEWMDDMDHNRIIPTKNNHIDNIVSDIVSSNFVEVKFLC